MEILARELESYPAKLARKLFDSYEAFLGLLDSEECRERLKQLTEDQLGTDEIFQRALKVSREFQDALQELFFGEQSRLRDLTVRYGVF